MRDKFVSFMLPVGGGSIGAVGSVFSNVTWMGIGEMALQAAVVAIVGGLIGWFVKRIMDHLFKKEDK